MGRAHSKAATAETNKQISESKPSNETKAVGGSSDFLGEVPEVTKNVCGCFDNYVIVAPMDDPIERDFAFYHVYDFDRPDLPFYAIIARPDVKRWRSTHTMNAYYDVLKVVQKKSIHFPTIERSGSVQKLIFGADSEQQEERDPEWRTRPVIIFSTRKSFTLVCSFLSFSPTGTAPLQLALHVGLGMMRALAALHRAGFISRFVTPYSFGTEVPYTLESIAKRMIFVDLCLAKEWPTKPSSSIQFTGTPMYSSIRIHDKKDQPGPADDVISVIYVVAELISGKLPWRSYKGIDSIHNLKSSFTKREEFRRLPHELRTIYGQMTEKGDMENIDHAILINTFKNVIDRKSAEHPTKLPKWLCMPYD